MRALLLLVLVGGCSSPLASPSDAGPDLSAAAVAPDLGCPTVSPGGASDGGACDGSDSCGHDEACYAGRCATIAACAADCDCPSGRTCALGRCAERAGTPCGPCDSSCAQAGHCGAGGCATRCDETKKFCPRGFRCDAPTGKTAGFCVPSLALTCAGCAGDVDCPPGEVCNPNNRRCVPPPAGADARLEMLGLDFSVTDMVPDAGTVVSTAREIQYSIGFFSQPDPSFDPFALAAGTCGSQRSGLDENAPFPLGPFGDGGDPMVLALPKKTVSWSPQLDPNPQYGTTYLADSLAVADWVTGDTMWSAPGGKDVGAFTVAGHIPADFTTTPALPNLTKLSMASSAPLTVDFGAAAGAGEGTFIEVSWYEKTKDPIGVLVRVACRAGGGASSATIPPELLAAAPRGVDLNLSATRATVAEFTTRGVTLGRATFGVQKTGTVNLSP